MSSDNEAKQERRERIARAPYEVGYGKPPQASQMKCGNKAASKRSPRVRSYRDILTEVMLETIPVKEKGRKRRMPNFEALIRLMTNKALAGDPRYLDRLLRYWTMLGFQPALQSEIDTIDAGEEVQRKLERMFEQIRAKGEVLGLDQASNESRPD